MIATVFDLAGWALVAGSVLFFITGALGLLRFPDIFSRLHAVTKTDAAGLGLLVAGLALLQDQWLPALLLIFIWLLVMGASTISCQLLARYSCEQEEGQAIVGEPAPHQDGRRREPRDA